MQKEWSLFWFLFRKSWIFTSRTKKSICWKGWFCF